MKKKIIIVEELGYRWRTTIVKRKEYVSIISVKIARLRRQNENENTQMSEALN